MQAARRLCQVENMKNFYISMKSNANAIGNVWKLWLVAYGTQRKEEEEKKKTI